MTRSSNDPFAALPVLAPHVRARADDKGRLQVKQTLPPGRGVRGFLARHFSMFPSRRICLDEQGSFFWQQIDGRQTLRDIETRLRERYQLEPQQSRDAVILFTKMLMRRGLIALQLPHSHGAAT